MRTTTKEQFAGALAAAVHEQVATPLLRARDRAARIFAGLRIAPVMTVDPGTGALGFTFRAGHAPADVDATIERLLELPAQLAAERRRRVALVFDEFQEVLGIDPHLPSLMRSVFQAQPDVAHVYLGSKRSMMAQLFSDANEPFWRSAKQIELGPIAPEAFGPFIVSRFAASGKRAGAATVERVLATTGGHPYATQELCYALWEETPRGRSAGEASFVAALDRVLRSENAHFALAWDRASRGQRLVLQALAAEPPSAVTSGEYRARHGLPVSSSLQKALDVLVEDELVRKEAPGRYRIAEPFLAEWLRANVL